MLIIPAIDIQGGRCVRLYKGDFASSTVYGDDPAAMAQYWQQQGAQLIHVVDLDGAKAGQPMNTASLKQIAAAISVPFQVGGGIRTLADIEATFALGASCVVISTAAIRDADFLTVACQRYRERLVVALDAKDGKVALRGWQETSELDVLTLARQLVSRDVMCLMYTDIGRDGTLNGPNLASTRALVEAVAVPVLASGGVSSLADITALREIGAEGAIVGKALYEQRFTLAEAIAYAT